LGVFREDRDLSKEKKICKKSQHGIAGLSNGSRQRRVQRNNENKIIIRTWNVRTLLHSGKMQELAEQISKTQLEIIAIQEIRWSGTGLIKKNRATHFMTVDIAVKQGKLALDFYSRRECKIMS